MMVLMIYSSEAGRRLYVSLPLDVHFRRPQNINALKFEIAAAGDSGNYENSFNEKNRLASLISTSINQFHSYPVLKRLIGEQPLPINITDLGGCLYILPPQ